MLRACEALCLPMTIVHLGRRASICEYLPASGRLDLIVSGQQPCSLKRL